MTSCTMYSLISILIWITITIRSTNLLTGVAKRECQWKKKEHIRMVWAHMEINWGISWENSIKDEALWWKKKGRPRGDGYRADPSYSARRAYPPITFPAKVKLKVVISKPVSTLFNVCKAFVVLIQLMKNKKEHWFICTV